VIYRLSMLDLVEGGSTWDEVVELARGAEDAGATMINTGIGWHEARVPTIATMVPRAAFAWVTRKLKGAVRVPLITTNRINDPAVAESLLARGDADMVSMARPFLADAAFVAKSAAGRAGEINTCIACNQACLDHIFVNKVASCLVNPAACREDEFALVPARARRTVAVVGAGPAGLACAVTAAERGHDVTLFEAAHEIGGQFNLAKRIPGKEEFEETLRYYRTRLASLGVRVLLDKRAEAGDLAGFDAVVLATGIAPRVPAIVGIGHPKVASYVDVVSGRRAAGARVAIVGAGGIGFDVAELSRTRAVRHGRAFRDQWGSTLRTRTAAASSLRCPSLAAPGVPAPAQGIEGRRGSREDDRLDPPRAAQVAPRHDARRRRVRAHRRRGLHVAVDGAPRVLDVDTVVICAGQESRRELAAELALVGKAATLIGGADVAVELDAKRAIEQGTRVAMGL
jgi:2,4-dienoyl-CoA reductase (NADPH2)